MPFGTHLIMGLPRRVVKWYLSYIAVHSGLLLLQIQQLYDIYALTQFRRSQVSDLNILQCLHICTVLLRSLKSSHRRKVVPIASVGLLEYLTTGPWYFTFENSFARSVRQHTASNDVVIISKDQIVSFIVTLVTPRVSRDLTQTLRVL
jgi:hypothetical protein